MSSNKFEEITKESVINADDVVRRRINNAYEYYKVKDYDPSRDKYVLEYFSQLADATGVEIVAPTHELINHFEKEKNEE